MLLVDGVPLGDTVLSREGNEGWDLLLSLLRHPTITKAARAFRQQEPEQIDGPEDSSTPTGLESVHDETVGQLDGGANPAVGASRPFLETGPSRNEDDQYKIDEPQRNAPSTGGVKEPAAQDASTKSGSGKETTGLEKGSVGNGEAKGTELHSTAKEQNGVDGRPTRRLVFACQRERATVLPELVDVVGTDEMTTCIAVGLRDPKTGRTSIAHIDGEDCIRNGIPAMLLSMEPAVNGPLELHLVGGYDDSDEIDDEDSSGGVSDLGENPGDAIGPDRSPTPGGSSSGQGPGGESGRSRDSSGGGLEKAEEEVRAGGEGPSQSEPSDAGIERTTKGLSASQPNGSDLAEAHRLDGSSQSDEEGLSPPLGKRFRNGDAAKNGVPGIDSGGSAKALRVAGDMARPQSLEHRPDPQGKRPSGDGFLGDLGTRGVDEDDDPYDDPAVVGGQSWPLAAALVAVLHRSNVCLEVKTACILGLNTKKVRGMGSLAMPVVRGLGIEPRSGRAFPVMFSPSARGPDGVVRGVCMMACGSDQRWQGVLTVPYQTATDTFHVGPCQYERMDSIARQMQAMDDRNLLLLTSTSPTSEAPEFLPATRKVLAFLVHNRNWWDVFPFDQPRVFVRTKEGGWRRTT